jgi:intein/homing endonuclease
MTKNNLVILGDDNNSEYSNGEITSIAIQELHDIFEDEKQYWEKKYKGVIYQNQLDILNAICNPLNHYINVIMARGSGKCVSGDTLLFTDNGLKEIQKFDNEIPEYTFNCNLYTKEGELESSKFFNNGIKQTIKITTNYGYQIEGSYEHPILIFDGEYKYKKLQEIKENDCVCIQRGQNYFSKYMPNIKDFKFIDKTKNYQHRIYDLPQQMSLSLARLLAYIVSEGCMSREKSIIFTNKDENLNNDFEKINVELFVGKIHFSKRKRHGSDMITINSSYIKSFLNYLGVNNELSAGKEVPWCIMQSPKEIVTEYLKTCFECEGSISNRSIEFMTASEKMSKQIHSLLLNFGIISSRRVKYCMATNGKRIKRPYYRIIISGHNIDKFYKQIGFISERKNELLYKNIGKKRNTNNDIIPFINEEIKKFHKQYKCEHHKGRWAKHLGKEIVGHIIWRYINALVFNNIKNVSYDKLILLNTKLKNKKFEDILKNNFYYDYIKKIEYGKNQVYDLEIPIHHNFTSNGFISHNSYGVALAYIEQAINVTGLKVAVFAPKAAQSKRLLTEMYEIINNASQETKDAIDIKNSSSMVIFFKNGSKIWALSGNSATFSEGEHPTVIICDESLSGETLITCEDNKKISIKDIVEKKLKVKVLTLNFKSNKEEFSDILNYFVYPCSKKCLEIEYICGNKIKKIQCTEDHKIYTKNRGYVEAKYLNNKDKVMLCFENKIKYEKIKKITEIAKIEIVYDIETKNHNFVANDMLVHNSHMISDYSWSSKISPMLGSHGYYQIVKIGVAMGKGHFNKGFNDKKYINLMCPWDKAERLKESGIFYYTDKDGIVHEYSKYVVDALMPPGAKKKYFPDRPDLITGPGEVSELDWLMQYELQWLDSISLFITEAQQKKLASGSHKLQITPYLNEIYVFGLDTASGSPNLETLGLDYTALSIWQLKSGKILKVFSKRWQGDPLMQYDEILGILKKFRVKYGLIDFSSLAYVFVEMLKRDGIKCDGIQYHSTCPESHKDWKTTIFDNFLARLNLDQIYYPILDKDNYKEYKDNVEMMNNLEETEEAFYEWCILQRIQSKNSTKIKISAPNKEHDDHSNCDALGVYAAIKASNTNLSPLTSIPLYVSRGATLYSGNNNFGR